MQSIDSVETYGYGTSKDLVSEKEEIKCNSVTKENMKEQSKLATNSRTSIQNINCFDKSSINKIFN